MRNGFLIEIDNFKLCFIGNVTIICKVSLLFWYSDFVILDLNLKCKHYWREKTQLLYYLWLMNIIDRFYYLMFIYLIQIT